MDIVGFQSGPLAANCYVLANDAGRECAVIDPGQQALGGLAHTLPDLGLRPAAILVTHGHFDHVADAAAAGAEYDVDVYIGAGDLAMLDDQWSALSPDLKAGVTQLLGPGEDFDNLRPERLTPLAGGEMLRIAGLEIEVLAVPGHTPGSVTYCVAGDDGEPAVLFTGDTLFARSIGRTDLPGGSSSQILESIRGKLLRYDDDTVVLPGHGPASTIGAERSHNPFL